MMSRKLLATGGIATVYRTALLVPLIAVTGQPADAQTTRPAGPSPYCGDAVMILLHGINEGPSTVRTAAPTCTVQTTRRIAGTLLTRPRSSSSMTSCRRTRGGEGDALG